MKLFKKISGLTLIELTIASTILIMVLTIVMSTYANFTSSKRRMLLTNELYNETMFLIERLSQEIHSGTIDYQGYWRENIYMENADNWIDEGVNPSGVLSDGDTATPNLPGYNILTNCGDPGNDDGSWGTDDSDTTEKQLDILYNYRYQFIYPGSAFDGTNGNDYHRDIPNVVHLNCIGDNYNTADGYNVYDDEPALGQGPRAIGNAGSNVDNSYTAADYDENSAYSPNILWDWNAKTAIDNTDPVVPERDQNPPLLFLKTNSDFSEYIRTAIRLEDRKVKLIRFTGRDTDVSPPDFIPDEWSCETDFACGNNNKSYDGSYVWNQKEINKNGAGNENIGEDNGINSITDTDLEWKDITPEKINITRFDFILSPVKDPHRAFFEKTRIQKPQVTLIIEAEARQSAMKGVKGNPPKVRIQTTVTPRIWDLIEVDN